MTSNRNHNSNQKGSGFTQNEINTVWSKGTLIPGYDPNTFRKDICGAWMQYSEYGNPKHALGWEIDHIISVTRGGSDHISNLQPLMWENNRKKSDNITFACAVTANLNNNCYVSP
jgi:HNH endonuclease